MHIDADANQAAWQRALVVIAAGHESGVRAAGAHGHAKALAVAHHNVGAPFAGRRQQGQGQQVGRHNGGGLLGVDGIDVGLPVHNPAAGGGVLRHGRKVVVTGQQAAPLFARHRHLHRETERLRARLHHLDGLRVHVARHHDGVPLGLHRAPGQRHGLGGGGGLVEHGGVGDGHAREVAHHGLEVDQRFHAAL